MSPSRDRARPGAVWARRLVLAGVIVYAALFAWTGRLVGEAERAFFEDRLEAARDDLERAAFWRVRGGRVRDALGVVALAQGRAEEADSHLARARRGLFHPAAFGEERVLTGFLREARFEPARTYAAHRLLIASTPRTAFYHAVSANGLNQLEEAGKSLEVASADPSLAAKIEAQRKLIALKRRVGRADFLFDRRGEPLAGTDLRSGEMALTAPDLASLLIGPHGPALRERDRGAQIRLTLDLGIQRAAEAALGAQRGAIVALDPRTGALLAAASQPRGTLALTRHYEPGSILKMLTLAAALREGDSLGDLFPMTCPGWIPIDGKPFRDWKTHGPVASIEEAVAESCNIAFGRLGLQIGRDALNAELRRFGFDPSVPPAAEAVADRIDFAFETGRLTPEDHSNPNFALARRAEGLDSLTITPIHAAMVAAGLARGGSVPVPYLIEEKTNLLGETYDLHAPSPVDSDVLPPDRAARIVRAMVEVVTSPGGTARRAEVDGIEAAMKTGTSGENPPGFDAIVIGFAPAGAPTIAWAVVAEHAGKAEWEAARITREFLSRIRDRLQ